MRVVIIFLSQFYAYRFNIPVIEVALKKKKFFTVVFKHLVDDLSGRVDSFSVDESSDGVSS